MSATPSKVSIGQEITVVDYHGGTKHQVTATSQIYTTPQEDYPDLFYYVDFEFANGETWVAIWIEEKSIWEMCESFAEAWEPVRPSTGKE